METIGVEEAFIVKVSPLIRKLEIKDKPLLKILLQGK
jgi:hypothetical protein